MVNLYKALCALAVLGLLVSPADARVHAKAKHGPRAHVAKVVKHRAPKAAPTVKWDTVPPAEGERMFTPFPSTFSTVNPSIPATGSSLSSAPIRSNFAAAYADINNLYTQLSTPLNFLTAGSGVSISATGTVALASIPANTLVANASGVSAVPGNPTLSAYLDSATTPAAGAVLYRGVSTWAAGAVPITGGASTQFSPSAASGGSANAQTFAAGNPSSWTLSTSNTVCGVAGFTNTGATTLAVNGTLATAVNRRSTTGLTALAGGEVVAGQLACFLYDGSVWELMTAVPPAVETQAANYVASVLDGNGDLYNFTGAGPTLTLPQSTTVPNTWRISAFAKGGPITLTPNAADSINGGVAGATVTLPQNTYSMITTDGAGNIFATGTAILNGQLTTMPASTIKGNATAGVAAVADLTVAQVQDIEGVFTAPQGRLTLTTTLPVMTASVTGATTVYYTPYAGNMVPIYNGATVQMYAIGELSQTTADATKSPAAVGASSCYDVFVWNDAGTIRATRGPAWTSVTARSAGTALAKLITASGRWLVVNNVAITNGPGQFLGTYVGTICSNASSTIDFLFGGSASGGSLVSLNVWNAYNRVAVSGTNVDNGAAYTYGTLTWRQSRASAANACKMVNGLPEDEYWATYTSFITTGATAGNSAYIAIGLDTTSTNTSSAGAVATSAAFAFTGSTSCTYSAQLAIGLHTFSANELGRTGTSTFGNVDTQYPTLICHGRM